MATPLTAVHGTDGNETPGWFEDGSPWWTHMRRLDFEPLMPDPFRWTGTLDGADLWYALSKWMPWIHPDDTTRFKDWIAAGQDLTTYLCRAPLEDRRVVVHSHGLAPALLCAASGCEIMTLVSVGSPVRHDLMDYIVRISGAAARSRVRWWGHVMDAKSDVIGVQQPKRATPYSFAGGIGDGTLSISRVQQLADVNYQFRYISHSGMFKEPSCFHLWEDKGLVEKMKASYPPWKGGTA